jgi:hypothetical protein
MLDRTLQYENKCITTSSDTKCLALYLNNTLDWRGHMDQLIPKLSSAFYAIRTLNKTCHKKL